VRRSGSFPAILVIAGAMALASAVTPAAPAVAAPHRLSAVPSSPIYGYGTNQFGELGNGTATSAPSVWPTRASGPPGTVSQLSAGWHTSGALMADGTVWTWGENYHNQWLGYDSGGAVVTKPRQVPGLSGITQLALGDEGDNGYAVGPGGSVWAWGDNSFGQLGNGTTTPSVTPILVPGLSGITQVAAGDDYALARGSDGSVWAWGENHGGSLGTGTPANQLIPRRLQDLSRITQVAAAGGASYAVRSDGTLFSWGYNDSGQLGNGTTGGFTMSPAPVPGLPGVTQVATSGVSVLAIDNLAERLWAWGYNGCGDLGDGTKTNTDSPELIGMTGVSQVMQGIEGALGVSSAAIRWDGRLWTWGCNGTGWLATGTTADAATPTLVANLTNVSQFALGNDTGLSDFGYSLAVGTLAGTVPSLIGDTQAQASAVLTAAGLELGTVSYVADYTCTTIGLVRSQSPSAGTSVPAGSAVSVTIGKAPPPPSQCP
jgi:alpha-tubulin suppressor-like RCC1 family protein